jgi:hypothetical protein
MWHVVLPIKMNYQSQSQTLTQEMTASIQLLQNPKTHQLQIYDLMLKPVPKPQPKPMKPIAPPTKGNTSNGAAHH